MKLDVSGITVRDSRGVDMVKDISFQVRAGEIVGIAGVAGNGQSELLQAIAGMRGVNGGAITLDGQAIDFDPAIMRQRGLAHVPEDRHHEGLVLPL